MHLGVLLSLIHQINEKSLRIDFYRVAPESEPVVVNNIRDRLGESNVAIFQALGHYDLIAIYFGYDENEILFKGGIDGIRSFSCIDCFYSSGITPKSIIETVLSNRLISLTILSLSREFLAKNGGIIVPELSQVLGESCMNFISLSWGEQIVLHFYNEMDSLWAKSRRFINWAQPKVLDMHTVVAVNYDLVDEERNNSFGEWNEKIDKSISIIWDLDLKCVEGEHSSLVLKEIISRVSNTFGSGFNVIESHQSFSNTNISCKLCGDRWDTVIKAIKKIRDQGSQLINSTRLRVLEKY